MFSYVLYHVFNLHGAASQSQAKAAVAALNSTVDEPVGQSALLTFFSDVLSTDAFLEVVYTLCALAVVVVVSQLFGSDLAAQIGINFPFRTLKPKTSDEKDADEMSNSSAPPHREGSAISGWPLAPKRVIAETVPIQPCVLSSSVPGETSAIAAAVRDGRASELPKLLDDAELRAVQTCFGIEAVQQQVSETLLCALRACAARKYFRDALTAYDHVGGRIGTTCCSGIFSLLLYIAVEAEEYHRCPVFIRRLRQFAPLSCNDFVNAVRHYAFKRDLAGLKRLLEDLRHADLHVEVSYQRRAFSACVSRRAFDLAHAIAADGLNGPYADTVSANMMMKSFVEAAQSTRCFPIYELMKDRGVPLSEQSYGILLNSCISAREFERAIRIFGDLRRSNVQLNVVHYTTLMKGLANAGRVSLARQVLEEMLSSKNTTPDVVTYLTLIKAYADIGNVDGALEMLDLMVDQGVQPTVIIFNAILCGCCVTVMEPRRVPEIIESLLGHGLKPSSATLSILVRALSKSNSYGMALELLDQSLGRFGIWPEPRVYAQLTQACAAAGHSQMAVKAFEAARISSKQSGIPLDEATMWRMIRACCLCGESAAASRIQLLHESEQRDILQEVMGQPGRVRANSEGTSSEGTGSQFPGHGSQFLGHV